MRTEGGCKLYRNREGGVRAEEEDGQFRGVMRVDGRNAASKTPRIGDADFGFDIMTRPCDIPLEK